MYRSLICSLALAAGFGSLSAQEPKVEPKEVPLERPAVAVRNNFAPGPTAWASVEALNWSVRPGPLPFPMITAGNPNVTVAGALLRPGTIPLTDNQIDFERQSGARATVGTWLDRSLSVGVEASAFTLFEAQGDRLTLSSATFGPNGLYVPAHRPDRGRQGSMIISDAVAGFVGFVSLDTTTRLAGAEVNGLYNVARDGCMSLDLLAGLRYAELEEHLSFGGLSSDLILLNDFTFIDQFRTRSQFYGGQVGFQGTLANDCWFISLRGTLAIGATAQTVDVQGLSQLTGSVSGTYVGGFYSQPSNVGTRTSSDFSVLPQAGLKVGVMLSNCLSVFAGYDCMYWRQVVRPGGQIDFRVDTPLPLGGTQPLTGTPVQMFNRSDFWAHGASIGLDFRY